MRYSAEDLMNDSWVISGPLITDQTYFTNTNLKTILKKSLDSRNKLEGSSKRPNTTANAQFQYNNRHNVMVANANNMGSFTHYKGFGEIVYKKTLDNTFMDEKQSLSVSLRPHTIANNTQAGKQTLSLIVSIQT